MRRRGRLFLGEGKMGQERGAFGFFEQARRLSNAQPESNALTVYNASQRYYAALDAECRRQAAQDKEQRDVDDYVARFAGPSKPSRWRRFWRWLTKR